MADGRIVETLSLDADGHRLETAIARANRGEATLSITRPLPPPAPPRVAQASDAVLFGAPARRRVGGLPLPRKSVHV